MGTPYRNDNEGIVSCVASTKCKTSGADSPFWIADFSAGGCSGLCAEYAGGPQLDSAARKVCESRGDIGGEYAGGSRRP